MGGDYARVISQHRLCFSDPEDEQDLLTFSQRFAPKSNSSLSVASKRATRPMGCKGKRAEERKFNDRFDVQTSAVMERAAELQSNLNPEFPSFFKLMLQSHFTLGFWLDLPMEFSRSHLPKCDTEIILEADDGVEYKTNFLSKNFFGLGGWRGFSLAHKLLEGDVLVFHLVLPHKFKVYIVRANRLAEVDGGLIHLDNSANEPACSDMDISRCEQSNQSHHMPLSHDIHQDMPLENDKMALNPHLAPVTAESANGKEVVTSEDMGDSAISSLSNSFVEFQDFKIISNGSIIDSVLFEDLNAKYYELCRTRKSYLHDRLQSMNPILAAGIISETMNTADAVRACKLSTFLNDYATWDDDLGAYGRLGMDVGFIRARLNRLKGLVVGSKEKVNSERYEVASCERDRVKEEVRSQELKLLELNQAICRIEKEMESLKEKNERYEIMFQEEASAPW